MHLQGAGRLQLQNDGWRRDCKWEQGWGPPHGTRPHWLAEESGRWTSDLCQVGWFSHILPSHSWNVKERL